MQESAERTMRAMPEGARGRGRAMLAFGSYVACALAVLVSTPHASAQMRVQGTRPVDPRLRNQPVIPGPGATVPTAGTVPTGSSAASPDATRGLTEARPVASGPSQQGGPLRRPSYLGGGAEGAPSAGPSSLDLMKQCFEGSISGTIANPACVGYLAGYVGAVRMSAGVPGFPICLPEGGLSNESIVADVSAYLENKTDALQKSARSVVFVVMSERYPCSRE